MARERTQPDAAEPVTDDQVVADPDAPVAEDLAQDGSHDPVEHAERLALDAGDRVEHVALIAHDLTADGARRLQAILRDALKRVDDAVHLHTQAGN